MKTIRLVYPQWQGGDIARWIPELTPDDAARGYYLGALLLDFLAPRNGQATFTVPVTTAPGAREAVDGVLDRDAILCQMQAALELLERERPDRVVTLGGECSVSVAPFTYLARRYADDMAVVWIDAHPDITLPGDTYAGFHAMALTACMGRGDARIVSALPAHIDPSRVLLVGVRDWERPEIVAAVGVVPGGMKTAEVVRVIGDIAATKELVALTVAEPMPRTAVRIRNMLRELPLLR